MTIKSFNPKHRLLMGPGPSPIYPSVLHALSRPTIGHLDPLFIEMMEEVSTLLRYTFQTENKATFAISAPGSAGMEAAFVNMIEPGDKVLVCINGVFGQRMKENIFRCRGIPIEVNNHWGEQTDLASIEEVLNRDPEIKILAFVHAETSTGVMNDAKAIAELGKKFGCLVIADCVTSLAGIPVEVDSWGIDVAYSGSQKCLSCVPGLSPITFSEQALKKIAQKKEKVQSWFLDLNLLGEYWLDADQKTKKKRSYHHTAPVNQLYALHEALVVVQNIGLSRLYEKHQKAYKLLNENLNAIGIKYVVKDENYRLPMLNHIYIPEGIDDISFRQTLLNDYNLEIGSGLGTFLGKTWRIGLMGFGTNEENVITCISVIKKVLEQQGYYLNQSII